MSVSLQRWPVWVVALSIAATVALAADGPWLTSLDAAQKQAKQSGKVVLAYFNVPDGCEWCAKLNQEVFGSDEFKAWARDHVVLLRLDLPDKPKDAEAEKQNKALKDKFQVRASPTVIFLDAGGKELGRIARYKKLDEWLPAAKAIVDKNKATE